MAEATLKPGAVPGRLARARRRASTTPGQLRLRSIVIASVAVVLTVIGISSLVVAWVSATNIQQRTVPAIMSMQRLHAWLSDADRSAANAYLAGGSEVTLSQQTYEADIAAASRELQTASEHDPSGDVASGRLQAVAVAVDQYAALVQTASVDDRQGLTGPGTVYLHAGSNLMHRPTTGILDQVEALRQIYVADLDRANLTLRATAFSAAAYALVAVVLLGSLVRTQRFLRARFRRRRNNRMVTATLLVLVVAVASGAGAVEAAQSIRTAQSQSYARLLNMWNLRALVYDVNGDESLSLIAHGGNPAPFDDDFKAKTHQLVDRPLSALLVFEAQHGQVDFSGLLADELRGADSDQERTAAVKALFAYQRFLDVDTVVRSTAAAANKFLADGNQTLADSNQKAAVTLTLGTGSAQLGFAFNELDWDLGVVINLLQQQFDRSMTTGELFLAGTAALEVLILAVAALAFWAVQPRIDEYTASARRRRSVSGLAS
jgi:hypothetical protein